MAHYTYRPAPLAGPLGFDLDGAGLICRTAAGATLWRLAWADVAGAALVEYRVRGMRMRRLDLLDAEGRLLQRLSRTADANARAAEDAETAAHTALMAAVLEQLAASGPDKVVRIGEYGRSRGVMFGLGVLSALAGAGIGAAALATGVPGHKLAAAAVPVVVMIALGAALMRAHAPWRARPQAEAGVVARALRAETAPEEEGTQTA